MSTKNPCIIILAGLAPLGLATSHAALVWDGSGDGVSAFQEANWTQNAGGDPAANTINPGVNIANDPTLTGGEIEVSAGTGSPSNIGTGLVFRAGTNNLTVSNGKILGGGSTTAAEANAILQSTGSILTVNSGGQIQTNGIAGFNRIVVDSATIDLRSTSGITFNAASGSNPTLELTNGALVDAQFIVGQASSPAAVTLDSGSSLVLNGGGIPINVTTVDFLDLDSQLSLTNEVFNNGTGQGFEPEHLSKVTYNGAPLKFGSDPFLEETGDNALATEINSGLGVRIQPLLAVSVFESPTPVVASGTVVTLEWNAPFFDTYSIDGGIGDVTGLTAGGIGSTTVLVNDTTTFTLTATTDGGATVRTAELTVIVSPDTDADGVLDYFETNTGIYVSDTDTGTDPTLADSDGDGYDDGAEDNFGSWLSATQTGTNPNIDDTDGDGLLDGDENPDTTYVAGVNAGSDPNIKDSDNDFFEDGNEFLNGADPTDPASTPALRSTFTYDVSDRLADAALLSTDNWTGDDLPNWLTNSAYSDLYIRNDNDGDNRITRTNGAGFSYSIPANSTSLTFDADVRTDNLYFEALLTTEGATTLGFGYNPIGKFFILDGETEILQPGWSPQTANARKQLRLVVDLVNQTADLLLGPEGAATVLINDAPVSVTAAQLHQADGIGTRTKNRFTGVYRFGLAVVSPFPSGSPYGDWAGGFGLDPETDGAPGEDADLDGKSNLFEFATNDNPISGAPSGKQSGRVRNVGGSDVLTLTLPVRGSATPFSGSTQQVSDPVDGIIYRIQGSADLSDWNTTVISEVMPALSAGLPTLDAGWEYRTFRTAGDIGSDPKHFIRAMIESTP